MANVKSERHHWWPEGVSQFWKNGDGCAHWLLPNGEIRTAPPKNFGVIGNGHQVRLGKEPGEAIIWDHSFEAEFQRADDNFPTVIRWLQGLEPRNNPANVSLRDRFIPQTASDDELSWLAMGLISLAIRSPMNREAAVSLAEHYRGPLPERERNALIALNMRNSYREAVQQLGINGKFVAIYSPQKELIFGDGFYHNIRSPLNSIISPTILAPLTPNIAALFVRPMSYTTMPRFFTLAINAEETQRLNHAVQVYARKQVFYRSEKPEITDAYTQEKHLIYSGPTNPIDDFIHHIPGVPPRDTSLDFLFAIPKR